MENEVTFLSHRKTGTPVWVSARSTQVRLHRAGQGCRRRAVGGQRGELAGQRRQSALYSTARVTPHNQTLGQYCVIPLQR